jgi:hypothetical protein
MKALTGEWVYNSTLSLISALNWGGWLTQSPGRFTPGKLAGYTLYRSLGGPRDRSGRVRKCRPTATGMWAKRTQIRELIDSLFRV